MNVSDVYYTKIRQEHFNSPLSREQTVVFMEKPKNPNVDNWRFLLYAYFMRVSGGMARTVINDRSIWQVVNYVNKYGILRDRLIVRLLLTRGLRAGEICSLKIENVDFEKGLMYVLDSKKKVLCEIPVDLETLVMLENYLRERKSGYVFRQLRKQYKYANKPMDPESIWELVKRYADKAGVKGVCPRTFRQHFIAFWMQRAGGRLSELQMIVRHKSPQVTWDYANKFVFADDVRREADRVTNELFKRGELLLKKQKEVENVEA